MKFFDMFRKNADALQPSDLPLEELLKLSAAQPGYRAELYKRILSDDLAVMTTGGTIPEGRHILEEETKANIVRLTDGKIPIFTSTERIFDNQTVTKEVEFLQMKGRDIFALAKGATFVLNPFSDYGKEFIPAEVERMLAGETFTGTHQVKEMQKDTQVQIGQPSRYPTEVVNALKILFSSKPEVKTAYVGWIYVPESGDPPHYIFGILPEPGRDMQPVVNEAGFTVNSMLPDGEFVDFVVLDDNDDGISDYFRGIEPFYSR